VDSVECPICHGPTHQLAIAGKNLYSCRDKNCIGSRRSFAPEVKVPPTEEEERETLRYANTSEALRKRATE